MGEGDANAVAGDSPEDLHFEDRLFLWLTAPLRPLLRLPPWALFPLAIWNGIGGHGIWNEWIYRQPTWLVALLVGPIIYLTVFGAVPMIIYSCLMLVLMPWHAPPPPRQPVRSIVRQRVGRLRTAMAQRRARRVTDGGWVRVGDPVVQGSNNGSTRRPRFRIRGWPSKIPLQIRWTLLALPKLPRKLPD